MFKKISIVLLVSLVIMMFCVVFNANAQGGIEKILSRGKIIVGMAMDEPPMAYLDEKGEPTGFQVAMANDLANAMGVKLELLDIAAAARISTLQTDKADLIISYFTRTLERALVVDFSAPYVKSILTVAYLDPKLQSLADLEGKKVAVMRGTTNADALKKYVPTAIPMNFEFSMDVWQALKDGKVDAAVENSESAGYYNKTSKTKFLLGTSWAMFDVEDLCIGVKKGNQDLLNWVNLFVYDEYKNGKIAEYYKEYFDAELDPLYVPWLTIKK
jgi:polar amino acid transport system substrate-binding protein